MAIFKSKNKYLDLTRKPKLVAKKIMSKNIKLRQNKLKLKGSKVI